jgi:hypothetical protein
VVVFDFTGPAATGGVPVSVASGFPVLIMVINAFAITFSDRWPAAETY